MAMMCADRHGSAKMRGDQSEGDLVWRCAARIQKPPLHCACRAYRRSAYFCCERASFLHFAHQSTCFGRGMMVDTPDHHTVPSARGCLRPVAPRAVATSMRVGVANHHGPLWGYDGRQRRPSYPLKNMMVVTADHHTAYHYDGRRFRPS